MAQVNVPESVGRYLYGRYFNLEEDFVCVELLEKDWKDKLHTYLKQAGAKFVVKPDHTISKRGKNNLLGIGLDPKETEQFLEQGIKEFNGIKLHRYIVTPFLPHSEEYYLSITAKETVDEVVFHHEGGIDVEENWDKVVRININVLADAIIPDKEMQVLGKKIADQKILEDLQEYLGRLLQYFRDYGFAFLEINPLIYKDGRFIPLDFKGRLDNCEFFNLQKHVDIYNTMDRVTDHTYPQEQYIKSLDDMTGASLKLKILNENARVWPMIAGGGASILYFDELVAIGLGDTIGFYGEYSGNPPFELTYAYANTIIELMLKSKAQDKVLLIAGANANFTDIVQTFKGIQQALEEHMDEIKKQNVTILIRRGGPNVKEAFKNIRAMADKDNIAIVLEGVDYALPHILRHISLPEHIHAKQSGDKKQTKRV